MAATQRRHPVVADLAREVRFRIVDEPRLRAIRDAQYESMEHHLAALVGSPDGAPQADHMSELVECPHSLAPLLLRHLADAPATRPVVLETMIRRYYRRRNPHDVRRLVVGGLGVVAAVVTSADGDEASPMHILATSAAPTQLDTAAGALVAAAAGLPASERVTFEVYTSEDGAIGAALSPSKLAETLGPTSAARPEQVVVAVSSAGSTNEISSVRHLTFAVGADGALVEDDSFLGLHPAMVARLQLWRLASFAVERLPSADDVYLARVVAHTNAKDQRLMAFAEVRDLTPVRDDAGRIVALPQLERVLLDALEGMRRVQAPLPPARRYQWNRVLLYVWPSFDLTDDEVERIARSLVPATLGLGIEEVGVRCRRPDPDER